VTWIEEVKDDILSMGSDNLARFGGSFAGGIHLQKDPMEYARLIDFLIKRKSKSYLEIGSAAGGGCYALNKYLKFNKIVVMDDNKHSKSHLRSEILKDVKHEEFIGDAHSKEAMKFIESRAPFDVILIDADQTYKGTLTFLIQYKKFLSENGIFVLHNITESSCSQVIKVDKEIEGGAHELKIVDRIISTNGRLGLGIYSR